MNGISRLPRARAFYGPANARWASDHFLPSTLRTRFQPRRIEPAARRSARARPFSKAAGIKGALPALAEIEFLERIEQIMRLHRKSRLLLESKQAGLIQALSSKASANAFHGASLKATVATVANGRVER